MNVPRKIFQRKNGLSAATLQKKLLDIVCTYIYEYIYSALIIENMTQHFIQTYYGCIHKSHGELSLLVKDTKFTFRLDSVAIKKKG